MRSPTYKIIEGCYDRAQERPPPPNPAARTRRPHADLDHAPGWALSARVPRDAREGRFVHEPLHQPRARLRSDVAAARALRSRCAAEAETLGAPDPEGDLRYVMDAARGIRRELDGRVPLIGFSGSPWTLATYMVEGSGSKEYAHVKGRLFDRPDLLHKLLDTTARAVTSYLNAQIAAGAQAVMVFDTWGGVLSPRDYIDFSLRYMAQSVDGLTREHEGRRVPVILFTKGGGAWLESMTETGCDALGVDWTTDIGAARLRVGDRVALQGNMDPCVLYASPERIRAEAATILKSYGAGPGHVFNLGHGIHQHVNPEHVKVLVDSVHELSAPYHRL